MLAASLREHHPHVDEYLLGHPPTESDIAEVCARAPEYQLLVVGTISASLDPMQVELVNRLVATGSPLVGVALRTPYDVASIPAVTTYVCSYGLRQPSLEATAAALFGENKFTGLLPVSISPEYPKGHGIITGEAI